jgi:hypothetical protein
MAKTKRPLKVFLCHADVDNKTVHALYELLVKDGVEAWLDKEKILPGQSWDYEIRKAVREADAFLVCLSKQFNQAGYRQKEVRLALDVAMEKPDGEIFIIPARLEECDTLESLRQWSCVDLFEDGGYEKLAEALKVRADKIGAAMRVKGSRKVKSASSETKDDDASGLSVTSGDMKAGRDMNNITIQGTGNVININQLPSEPKKD